MNDDDSFSIVAGFTYSSLRVTDTPLLLTPTPSGVANSPAPVSPDDLGLDLLLGSPPSFFFLCRVNTVDMAFLKLALWLGLWWIGSYYFSCDKNYVGFSLYRHRKYPTISRRSRDRPTPKTSS